MKMTKLIREYITDEITKKYQPLIDAVNNKYDLESGRNILRETTKEITEYAKNLYRERLAPYYAEEDLNALLNDYTIYGPSSYRAEPIANKKHGEEISALTAARGEKIRDVLITMELGGTKADLDKMLSEINPSEEV